MSVLCGIGVYKVCGERLGKRLDGKRLDGRRLLARGKKLARDESLRDIARAVLLQCRSF